VRDSFIKNLIHEATYSIAIHLQLDKKKKMLNEPKIGHLSRVKIGVNISDKIVSAER